MIQKRHTVLSPTWEASLVDARVFVCACCTPYHHCPENSWNSAALRIRSKKSEKRRASKQNKPAGSRPLRKRPNPCSRVPEDIVETQIVDTVNTQDIVLNILETAHARHCGTVVVGRKSYHGLKALLTSHISDALISQGEDLAVWVVE